MKLYYWLIVTAIILTLTGHTVIQPVAAAEPQTTTTDPTTEDGGDQLEPTDSVDSAGVPADATPATTNNTTRVASAAALTSLIRRRNIDTNDVNSIGMALFSSESQAEIDLLTPLFESALTKQRPDMQHQSFSDWKYAVEMIQKLINDQYLTKKMNMATYGKLQKGDIMLRRTGYFGCKQWVIVPLCKYWAFMYEHAGVYYGVNKNYKVMVYESSNVGGVQFKSIETWKAPNTYVGIYRGYVSPSKIATTFETLIAKYGQNGKTPYNYNLFNKYTDSALYCSQLVWKFYLMMGIDLDSNNPLYGAWLRLQYGDLISSYAVQHAVAPDEIGLSTKIYRVANGWNQ